MIILLAIILFLCAAWITYYQQKNDTLSMVSVSCMVFSVMILFSKAIQ